MSLEYILMGAIIKNVSTTPKLPPKGGHQGQTRIYKQALSKKIQNKPQKFVTLFFFNNSWNFRLQLKD